MGMVRLRPSVVGFGGTSAFLLGFRPGKADGQGGIRTPEGVSQQIYSLPPLAAWVPARLEAESLRAPALSPESWDLQLELAVGLAPTTACLQNRCSTVELRQLVEARTARVVLPAAADSRGGNGDGQALSTHAPSNFRENPVSFIRPTM